MFWKKSDALELIELTYALIDEEDGYQNLFDRIRHLFGDAMFALQMWDDSAEVEYSRMVLSGWDANSIDEYVKYYSSVNPFLPLIAQRSSGDVYHLYDLIPENRQKAYEFLNDFQFKNGNYAGITATILKEENRYGALSVDGPIHTKKRWSELRSLIEVLTPHLQRVMHLSRKLQTASVLSSVADFSMERAASIMMVVDTSGRLAFANASAMAILSGGGVLKTGPGGLLTASTFKQTQQLLGLISSATQGDSIDPVTSGGFINLSSNDDQPLLAMVAPLQHGIQQRMGLANVWSSLDRYAVIFLVEPNSRVRLPSEVLMMQYNLTKTEAELALHLYEGGTLADYCDKNFVTLNTARTQLKAIFHKTGVSRQGSLVALLNCFAVFSEHS